MNVRRVLPLVLLLPSVALAQAPDAPPPAERLVVVATLPYLADVARAIGGDEVEVSALLPPGTDPHFLQPTPALSVVLARADVYLENGFQLELWSERVIDGARNQRIRPGNPGQVYAGNGVQPLQVPTQQSRAQGDVHPSGNPHVWLDPLNLKVVAANVEATLARVRPGSSARFAARRAEFEARLDQALYGADLVRILGPRLLDRLQRTGRLRAFLKERQFLGQPLEARAGGWLKRALDLKGLSFVSYHQVWTYFAEAFGLPCVGTIEEKPGIPPSPDHLDQLVTLCASQGTKVVECSAFYPFSRAEALAERIGGVAVQLPTQPGEAGAGPDVFALFDEVFRRLEEASRGVATRPAGE